MEASDHHRHTPESAYGLKRETSQHHEETSANGHEAAQNPSQSFKLPTPQDIQRQLWQIQQQVGLTAPDSSTSPSSSQAGGFDFANSILNWGAASTLASSFFDPDSMWKLRNLQLIQANLMSLQESLNATLQEASSLVRSDLLSADDCIIQEGQCQWPGCNAVLPSSDIEASHLSLTHGLDFNSIGQVRVQMQCVRSLESALSKEKLRLAGMVRHLRENSYSLTAQPQNLQGPSSNGALNLTNRYTPPNPSSHGAGPIRPRGRPAEKSPITPLGGDLSKNRDFYNTNDIRPPFTYASLIRQAIAEAPNMQLTLNEIYIWFQRNFAYFRRNEATWKNAVRHNLSLHKCFTRVENVKGAVWTVDETEFSNRRSQRILPLSKSDVSLEYENSLDGQRREGVGESGMSINYHLDQQGSETGSNRSPEEAYRDFDGDSGLVISAPPSLLRGGVKIEDADKSDVVWSSS